MMAAMDWPGRTAIRDALGSAIFAAGSAFHRAGLWLCRVAGWWDAGTDR